MGPADVVALLNEATGCQHRLIAPCPGGESGRAFFIADQDGTRRVLKFEAGGSIQYHRQVSRRVDRLRRRGVPTAHQKVYDLGALIAVVQQVLPGQAGAPLTQDLLDQLTALNSLQRGLADEPPDDWRELMCRSLTEGLDGYCEHASLRTGDDRTRVLLDRIHHVGRTADYTRLSGSDVVHYDLHNRNILTVDGAAVSGIIDWAAFTGDAHFDLVMLAFTSLRDADEATVEAAWATVFEADRSDRTQIYVAHACLRVVDWILRHYGLAQADWAIDAGNRAMNYAATGRYIG